MALVSPVPLDQLALLEPKGKWGILVSVVLTDPPKGIRGILASVVLSDPPVLLDPLELPVSVALSDPPVRPGQLGRLVQRGDRQICFELLWRVVS